MPSRPWPRIVRGRMIVTSRPCARTASRPAARRRAWPRRRPRAGRGAVVLVDRIRSGTPNTALDEVCTTLRTPAARAASRSVRVPPPLTDQKARRSLASGTCATLWWTTSTPSQARAHRAGVADVALDELDAARPIVGVDEIEARARASPRVAQPLAQQAAEVARAAGDERGRSRPRPRSDRESRSPGTTRTELRRMPSRSATSARSRARRALSIEQAIVWFISPSTWIF